MGYVVGIDSKWFTQTTCMNDKEHMSHVHPTTAPIGIVGKSDEIMIDPSHLFASLAVLFNRQERKVKRQDSSDE